MLLFSAQEKPVWGARNAHRSTNQSIPLAFEKMYKMDHIAGKQSTFGIQIP
jgi:hypothetical protein